MQAEMFVSRVLDDEGLIDGLDEDEAGLLVEWLVQRTERIAASAKQEVDAWKQVEMLCKRGRAIARLVVLACQKNDQAGAAQLAERERLPWPPPAAADAHQVLQHILNAEKT